MKDNKLLNGIVCVFSVWKQMMNNTHTFKTHSGKKKDEIRVECGCVDECNENEQTKQQT